MLERAAAALADLPGLLARIPPLWLLTLGLALFSVTTAARQNRKQDAFLMTMMLLSCLFCVVYLCLAGDALG